MLLLSDKSQTPPIQVEADEMTGMAEERDYHTFCNVEKKRFCFGLIHTSYILLHQKRS